MNRAVEGQNMALFTLVGEASELVVAALRQAIVAMADGDAALAGAILEQGRTESPATRRDRHRFVSGSPWACSMTGCRATTRTHLHPRCANTLPAGHW